MLDCPKGFIEVYISETGACLVNIDAIQLVNNVAGRAMLTIHGRSMACCNTYEDVKSAIAAANA